MMDVSCNTNCKYFGHELPRYLPTPTCRLFAKYNDESNPVTKSVLREIIAKRIQCSFNK